MKLFAVKFLFACIYLLVSFSQLQAQSDEDKPGNTSITLGISINQLGLYAVPPVGLILDFGVGKWGAIGIYGGYQRFVNSGSNGISTGGRVTAQVMSIVNAFLDSPVDLHGLKPYVGFASGYYTVINNRTPALSGLGGVFSASPVVGTFYYPINGIGIRAELGETFNGRTGFNLGIVFGGRQ